MSWESQPKATHCVGGQEGNGGASGLGTIGFYLCLGGERLQKATNSDLTDPRYSGMGQQECVLREPSHRCPISTQLHLNK